MLIFTLVLAAFACLVDATDTIHAGSGPSTTQTVRDVLEKRDIVSSSILPDRVTLARVLTHAQKLQSFAYAYPDRNRLVDGAAHNDSIHYFYNTLTSPALKGYYNVAFQPFSLVVYNAGTFALTADGSNVEDANLFEYSPNGNVDDYLVKVDNLGCDATDYPAAVIGHIALISRGTCQFGFKVALAGNAGAAAAIIYNNAAGSLAGTLGGASRPEGPYVPALSVSLETGSAWAQLLAAGTKVPAKVLIEGSVVSEKFTYNVIAQTVGGDQNNVIHLGAHSDSVEAGPGINDNGSGSIALLEVAIQLSKFSVNNAVRSSWWAAEEQGLVGSTHYVSLLSEEEASKIRLYLNFDMIASPNYVLAAYDGDGSSFGITGPPGSAEAEALFHRYYASVGQNSTSSAFNGRSDYGPFLDVGVACGGLDTGAEGIKTAEEAEQFGGKADVAYDINYHGAGDTVDNLALKALETNSKAIAFAVGVYGASFEILPKKGTGTGARKGKGKKATEAFVWRGGVLVA